MSETARSTDHYSPISRLEERSQRVPELLAVLVALAGLLLQGERLGVLAGVVLVVLWLFLRVEFVFATGVLAVAGLGDPLSLGTVLTLSGLGGLLAVDLARTWDSIGAVALFLALFVVAGGILAATQVVAVRGLGLGAAALLAGLAYALHRYERFRFGTIDTATAGDTGPVGESDWPGADRDTGTPEDEP
ncbi:hypothetical protein ACOZ4L_09180 [Haloplanus ruber]|uniref:DUF8163 domain-containing protein n=1 Tax=Haloplanus ruber TaxID=869892 RepID=A0ABD6CWU5_9EURY|nr:hypothetical protein [Haloplanus ruber]